MPLYSKAEVLRLKLSTLKTVGLKNLAENLNLTKEGSASDLIKRIHSNNPDENVITAFIKKTYQIKVEQRKNLISDEDLKNELNKVKTFVWGIEQGQLDRKIQAEYVRIIPRFDDLLYKVKNSLFDTITNHVVCSWYNYWSTVYIEEHIATHPYVIPTIKSVKGTDIFFSGQPFDLKVTYVPKSFNPQIALEKPIELAKWMYEHQGEQRFGSDNRLFVILLDQNNPADSWKIKRNFDMIFCKLDEFFQTETVDESDQIEFFEILFISCRIVIPA